MRLLLLRELFEVRRVFPARLKRGEGRAVFGEKEGGREEEGEEGEEQEGGECAFRVSFRKRCASSR